MCDYVQPGFHALDYAMMGLVTFVVASGTHVVATRARDLIAQFKLVRAAALG